jgi:hypothetical protein
MVIMSAALLLVGGRNILAMACLATALLVARSSSALLAVAVGALVYLVFHTRKARLFLLALPVVWLVLGLMLEAGIFPPGARIVILLKTFYEDPFYLIVSDYSTNARLGGIWVGIQETLRHGLLPAGLSSEFWVDSIPGIMSRNPWLYGMSEAGIPSGLVIVIYQLGVFGLGLVGYFLWRMTTGLRSHAEAFLISAAIVVFFSQYMISAPGFGLLYGILLARRRAAAVRTGPPPLPHAADTALHPLAA